MFIGDSIVENEIVTSRVRSGLLASFDDGGMGWISATGTSVAGASVSSLGTWTSVDSAAGSVGPAIQHKTSSDEATPASLAFAVSGTDATIHYLKQSGGGSFRYRVDGGAWTTVDTVNSTSLYATEAISGLASGAHTVDVEVVTASTSGVAIAGLDVRDGASGLVLANAGNGGSNTSQWGAVDATMWQAAVTAIDPDVVFVMSGPNDRQGGVAPEVYVANLTELVARIRTAAPSADVVILSPVDAGTTATYGIWPYVEAAYFVAAREGTGFVNNFTTLGDYPSASDNYSDQTHPNATGGQIIADGILDYLD